MEGVSQYGGWLRFWTGNEQLSRQSELISRSEGRRRKRGRGRGEGRKLVHESVVARDRGVVVVVVVVHERDPWNDRDWNAVRAHLSIRNKIGDLAMAKIERAYKIDLRKKGFKRFSRVPGEKSPPGIVPLSSPSPPLPLHYPRPSSLSSARDTAVHDKSVERPNFMLATNFAPRCACISPSERSTSHALRLVKHKPR